MSPQVRDALALIACVLCTWTAIAVYLAIVWFAVSRS